MAGTQSPDRWKHKYFEALGELEEKEKYWEEAEAALKLGLGRLAVLSQGSDPVLDKRLATLRKELKKGASPKRIRRLIDDVSERARVLDEASGGAFAKPQQVLGRLLEAVPLPRGLRRRARKLARRIEAADAEAHLPQLVSEVAELLGEALAPAADQPGLLGRLFGRGGSTQERPGPAPDGDLADPDDDTPDAVVPSATAAPAPSPATERAGDALRLVEGVFVDFLEYLTFPSEYSARVQALKLEIEAGIEVARIKPLTEHLVTLIVDVRKALEAEKEELEQFLQQLTARLLDLDAMIEGAESHRRASLESGRRLDAMVQAQVSDIENVVRSATELEQMKLEVQSSLESIRSHLAAQRDQEEARQELLERQLKQMTERLKQMEEESARLRQRLEAERANALTDPLTGAPNRLAFDQRMEAEFARWQRHGHPLSLVVMDIDHFKRINDTFGHKAGDRALKAIVQALRQHVRGSDFMARVGGEEFVLILPDTDLEGAERVAEKIRAGIERSEFAYKGQPVPVTVSGGITQFREGDTPESAFERADEALYRAKREGRNRFITA